MQTETLVKRLVQVKPFVGATMVALAVALPYAFHSVGVPGTVALPMHLPVLLMGMLFGPAWGGAVGLIAPGVNTALTGMPPLAPPIMQLMTFELAAYGVVAGWARQHLRWGRLQSLALALVAGRIALYLAALLLGTRLGLPMSPEAYLVSAVSTGWPGIVFQLIVLPLVAKRLERLAGHEADANSGASSQ